MNLLFRLFWIFLRARWQPKSGLLQPCQIPFIVLPFDLDALFHMNNGRYFSIMDLGRVDLFVRSGLFDAVRKAGYGVTIAAETVQFRRSLRPFQRFILESRILGWDEKSFFIEQRFLRSPHRGAPQDLMASGVVRARLLAKDGTQPSTAFIRNFDPAYFASPSLPSWIIEWNGKQIEATSQSKLRAA